MWWDGSHDWSAAMELCQGMDEEPTESFCFGSKEKTDKDDTIVSVFYRPPDQKEHIDDDLHRQVEAALYLQTLFLMGEFNRSHICCRDNTAGYKESRRFMEFIEDNLGGEYIVTSNNPRTKLGKLKPRRN